RVQALDLLFEGLLDVGALLDRSTHGCCSLLRLPLLRALGDEAVGTRVVPRLETHRRFAPRRLRHAADRRLRLAAAVRVVARRHHDTADRRAPAHVPLVARAADLAVLVLDVADLTDRGAAAHVDHADAARRKPDLRVLAFLRHELRRRARRANELRAATGLQLDPVDLRSGRDVLERQVVADASLGVPSREDLIADTQVVRRDDVALLAVSVHQERETRGAVRVVLDRDHARGHAVLVALEVDLPVVAL